MTDEAPASQQEVSQTDSDLIVRMKEEFAKQLADLTAEHEKMLSELNQKIGSLSKENETLQSAIVQSASVPNVPVAPEPTPEEQYADLVDRCVTRTKELII